MSERLEPSGIEPTIFRFKCSAYQPHFQHRPPLGLSTARPFQGASTLGAIGSIMVKTIDHDGVLKPF